MLVMSVAACQQLEVKLCIKNNKISEELYISKSH